MDSQNQSSIITFFNSTVQTVSKAAISLKDHSVKQLSNISIVPKCMQDHLQKAHGFYKNHKEIVLITSAVAITYFFTRRSNKKVTQEKPKIKKSILTQKTFVSDQDEIQNQQPSVFTGKTAESSERELVERRCKQKILQKLSSQSESENQKIFFQMYKTYRNS